MNLVPAVDALLEAHPDGVLPIVSAGAPVLRAPAARYGGELGAERFHRLLEAMRVTMRTAPGVGLAAPQIGLPLAIAVIEDPGVDDDATAAARERVPVAFRVLVNPTYTPAGPERVSFYEGCLSVPGYVAVRARWRRVRLLAADEAGNAVAEELAGWPARIVQHEVDHLAGELYLDAAAPRSLASDAHAPRWASEAVPRGAATVLGFPLEGAEPTPRA
ncbi:Peptide deformylase [Beutenbergia cavernae DSM 12333]|uniref:Peptide deformylase n=1 Tax=Beutenbergia cavernae (strain ATCC BAA-8 / DSM 12333 / CCUG 43141 / JCM 11478 / NBRC 16432 / NCIMB 13614 / HKI 0122) TaxID=471853 RepID=C5C017_BEUC1|nr:peptide deformylase [Beutenbergia cavernae]ACQ81347.1 Peptide deformylase [Beutenbergia cavernae DSM 12333]